MGNRVKGIDTPQAIRMAVGDKSKVATGEAGFKDSIVDSYGDKSDIPIEDKEVSRAEKKEERKILSHKPFMNVISKKEFDNRVEEVFNMMGDALAKSYGPYGATTLISQYPNYHITKDGYTIAKNLAFDKSASFVDQIICGLACDICGRLNYSVGDGTTTAVVATNSIFESYRNHAETLKSYRFLPRDIMRKFEEIKEYVINYLLTNATSINVMDKEELAKYIADIVYVSSNGDKEMTDIISSLYKEMRYPSIDVRIAADGITKKKIINGFRIDTSLTDALYVNNDNKTMELGASDVIIFDHKITLDTYENTLRMLSSLSKNRGRHLICIAPFYDENAIATKIAHDLKMEYEQTKDINLVLMVCKNTSAHHKKMLNNLAMLMNTEIISREKSMEINAKMDKVLSGEIDATYKFPFNIDNREIAGANVLTSNGVLVPYDPETMSISDITMKTEDDDVIRLGYVDSAVLGMKESTFTGFHYNEGIYKAYLSEAERELEEAEKKYQKLATFNIEIDQCQERLNGLNMNIGVIEVGSDSQFAQSYLKDQVDDCVRASRSAYKYGVIDGCSISVIRGLDDYVDHVYLRDMSDKELNLTQVVYEIFRNGFVNVYKTLMKNMDMDFNIQIPNSVENPKLFVSKEMENLYGSPAGTFDNVITDKVLKDYSETTESGLVFDSETCVIEHCTENPVVFDLTTGTFSNKIINSAETDIQILRATSDLIKLLITGNQLVVSMYTQFQK